MCRLFWLMKIWKKFPISLICLTKIDRIEIYHGRIAHNECRLHRPRKFLGKTFLFTVRPLRVIDQLHFGVSGMLQRRQFLCYFFRNSYQQTFFLVNRDKSRI